MKQKKEQGPEGLLETLEKRLEILQHESKEAQFDTYLEKTKEQLAEQKLKLGVLGSDIERNYGIYQKRMEQAKVPASSVYNSSDGNQTVAPVQPFGNAAAPEQTSTEFKIGAGVLGVVGVLFIIAAFMIFGTSYLQGSAGFLITAGVVFLANVVLLLIPVKRGRQVSHLVQLAGNTVITWILALVTTSEGIENNLILFYVISSVIVANMVFRRLKKNAVSVTLFTTVIGALGFLYLFISSRTERTLAAFGILAMVCLCFFLLEHATSYKWIQYWYLCLMIIGYTAVGFGSGQGRFPLPFMTGILTVFVMTKLLSRVPLLRISEIITTVLTAFCGLWYYGGPYGIYFLAAFLLSVLALHRDKMFYQIVITVMGAAYFIRHPFLIELTEGIWHYEIFLAGTVSILLLCMLLFNLVKPWRQKGTVIYNYCCLSCMALLYLTAFLCSNYVIYSILTVAGILTILVVLRDSFGIHTRLNYLFLTFFLIYMVFLFRIRIPFQTSILLMCIAVFSIIIGFVLKRRGSRLSGLAICVFVSLKVVFFDFIGLPALERIWLFLIVGITALVIAVVYILLEKRIAVNKIE